MAQEFDWLKPSCLWQADGFDYRQQDFFQPQLFRFDTDEFMESFLAAVAAPAPDALAEALAVAPDTQPLKLFQPIHGSFYLVSGSLCCREPGFPDRVLDAAGGEHVFFVLRKLIGTREYAWVSEGKLKGWNDLNGLARSVLKEEEHLPLYSANRPCGRSLFVGYLPVASRETYNIAPAGLAALTGDDPASIEDGRIEQLRSRFVDQLAQIPSPSIMGLPNTPSNIDRTISVYLLLDLWELLAEPNVLPDVAAVLRGDPGAILGADKLQAKTDLLAFLAGQTLHGTLTLSAALGAVARKQTELNQSGAVPADLGFDANYNLQGVALNTTGLEAKVRAALSEAGRPTVELPKLEPRSDARYVLRMVYERPQCEPVQRFVSQPSVVFVLAPFFDAEAPARPVKIPLPTHLSLADMRKFKKNVSFMISNELQKKITAITGHESGLLKDPPEVGPETDDGFAFICSFSIQIIFIVAFFLLLIFVIVLNFVFWWIAFFKICLPVPKKLLQG